MKTKTAPRLARISLKKPSLIGLALGGGAARGWAHIGALRALLEAGLAPDVLSGTSIGTLVGGAYLAGHLDTLEDWARTHNRRCLLKHADFYTRGTGLIRGERFARIMERYMGEACFESLPAPFICVSTELTTGHEIWLNKGPLVPAIRASCALPGIFRPVCVDGRWLVDGGLVNSVPVSACRALGARLIIAIGLDTSTLKLSEHAPDNTALLWKAHSLEGLRSAYNAFRRLQGAPDHGRNMKKGLSGVLMGSFNIAMEHDTNEHPPDFYILPRIKHIGYMDFHRADKLIKAGHHAMSRQIPRIKDAVKALRLSEEPACNTV